MEKYDVAPKLYAAIMSDFNRRMAADKTIAYIVANGRTYVDASKYAVRVGEHLAAAFRNNLSSGVLPDGKMYYNIAERAVRPAIENNRLLVNGISEQVQRTLNESAGIGLAVQTPTPNTDRVDGIINRLTQAEQYDDAAWLLDEPIINISQSFVDDFIRTNAEFHAQSGLPAMITRTTSGECCDWCAELAGRYEYGFSTMPQDIFRRHERCRCMVLYDPADGRGYQNVHSKKWNDPEDVARIEERKKVGLLESGAKRGPGWREKHAELYYEEVRKRAPYSDAARISGNLASIGINGLDAEIVEQIRQHLFINEQPRSGGTQRFDADYDQAQAWQRLVDGKNIRKSDVVLLEHERVEMLWIEKYGYSYEEAHDIANESYNWAMAIREEEN